MIVHFIDRLDHLPDGLHWLASRGAAASFEALVADLAAHIQPGQFIARLKALISELPLPETLPPDQIGKARRIDRATEIHTLGKRYKNCLATRAKQIDAGECAIYLWDEPAAPALCQVTRRGRLGWILSEVLGPRNAELEQYFLHSVYKEERVQNVLLKFRVSGSQNLAQYPAQTAATCHLAQGRRSWLVPQVDRTFPSIDLFRASCQAILVSFAERVDFRRSVDPSCFPDLVWRQGFRQRQFRNQCFSRATNCPG